MRNRIDVSFAPLATSFMLGIAATLTVRAAWGRWNASSGGSGSNNDSPSQTRVSARSLGGVGCASITKNVNERLQDYSSASNNTGNVKETDVMDSPDLDLRLIRKAEAVIQWRSGNLTVVIERSTNSWNHSAILRTAEALVRIIGKYIFAYHSCYCGRILGSLLFDLIFVPL